ncbi:MAG: 50S ribosomal protein L20 [Anaplasmataceae bacterium]|nr:50S ribosomal protein L20 [Anaplasmataceae bacterium]
MTRTTAGPSTRRRHKKILKLCKGYRGRARSCFSVGIQRLERAWTNAYKDRKRKKRTFRSLWVQRINAAVREYGMSYSQFMGRMLKTEVNINRKTLSEIAIHDRDAFKEIFDKIVSDTQDFGKSIAAA